MATVARTVHLNDPETGELVTLEKGTEIPDDQLDEFQEKFNNPTIFEDPDAVNVDGEHSDFDSLSDDDFLIGANANNPVDVDTFDEDGGAGTATGGISFDETDYSTWKIGKLREEYNDRVKAGREVPEADMRDKDSIVAALSADDDAGNL